MDTFGFLPGAAIVTGASGQDGYFLTERLLTEGWVVHAVARRIEGLTALGALPQADSHLLVHKCDLLDPSTLLSLIIRTQPGEFYNLAGQSSVSQSFDDPWYSWRTNAEAVFSMLECVRVHSPSTRFYQSSSTDMFGSTPGGSVVQNENSALNPQSPYASAKAAAHMLCRSYREAYGLRITCGILSNHESHRRPAAFLTRKVVEHVRALRKLSLNSLRKTPPLSMGNLKIQRDWGYAPDYVEGICRILRQLSVRARFLNTAPELDDGASYRDYVLGTGQCHAVWQLVDRAFSLAGLDLEWHLDGNDPTGWHACFKVTGSLAVIVDPSLLRPSDPSIIRVDASLARKELGWSPGRGLDALLVDMLAKEPDYAAEVETAWS